MNFSREVIKEIRERAKIEAQIDPAKRSFKYWFDHLMDLERANIEDEVEDKLFGSIEKFGKSSGWQ